MIGKLWKEKNSKEIEQDKDLCFNSAFQALAGKRFNNLLGRTISWCINKRQMRQVRREKKVADINCG